MTVTLGRRTCLALLAAVATPARAATPLRIGLLHTASPAPLYIAQGRGYFADVGLDVTFRFFEAAQPIAAAAVAGDIDIGITALTGGFFGLASKGALVVIGGALHEEKGYQGVAIIASRGAYDAGLTSVDKLPGHSFGITQYGASFHYMLGRVAEVRGFDLKSVTLRPLQQITNMIAAVRTGQVDATMAVAPVSRPAIESGEAVLLGWVGDLVQYQLTAVFTTRAMIAAHADALHAFAAAYQRGIADYRAAFLRLDATGQPIYDAKADAAIPLIEHYVFTGDPHAAAKIKAGLGYYDEGGALDVRDVTAQLKWFEAQGLVKGDVDPASIIDTSFLPVLFTK